MVLLMQNKAEVLFQQMESRPIWQLLRADQYSDFFRECFMYKHRPDPKHDPLTGPSPFELSLDRKIQVLKKSSKHRRESSTVKSIQEPEIKFDTMLDMDPLVNKWLPKEANPEGYKATAKWWEQKSKPQQQDNDGDSKKRSALQAEFVKRINRQNLQGCGPLVDKNEVELRKTMHEIVHRCPKATL